MKKTIKKKIQTKDFGVGLGGIGVPASISQTPMNVLPGQPLSTPQTTVTGWPAPNLWYAQGRGVAKKTYYEYLNADRKSVV